MTFLATISSFFHGAFFMISRCFLESRILNGNIMGCRTNKMIFGDVWKWGIQYTPQMDMLTGIMMINNRNEGLFNRQWLVNQVSLDWFKEKSIGHIRAWNMCVFLAPLKPGFQDIGKWPLTIKNLEWKYHHEINNLISHYNWFSSYDTLW